MEPSSNNFHSPEYLDFSGTELVNTTYDDILYFNSTPSMSMLTSPDYQQPPPPIFDNRIGPASVIQSHVSHSSTCYSVSSNNLSTRVNASPSHTSPQQCDDKMPCSPTVAETGPPNPFSKESYDKFRKQRWQEISDSEPRLDFKEINRLVAVEWKRKKDDAGVVSRKRNSVGQHKIEMHDSLSPSVSSPSNPTFYCQYCKRTCSTAHHYNSHIRSKKHLKNVSDAGGSVVGVSSTPQSVRTDADSVYQNGSSEVYSMQLGHSISYGNRVPDLHSQESHSSGVNSSHGEFESLSQLSLKMSNIINSREREVQSLEAQAYTLQNSRSYREILQHRRNIEMVRSMVNAFQNLKMKYRKVNDEDHHRSGFYHTTGGGNFS